MYYQSCWNGSVCDNAIHYSRPTRTWRKTVLLDVPFPGSANGGRRGSWVIQPSHYTLPFGHRPLTSLSLFPGGVAQFQVSPMERGGPTAVHPCLVLLTKIMASLKHHPRFLTHSSYSTTFSWVFLCVLHNHSHTPSSLLDIHRFWSSSARKNRLFLKFETSALRQIICY